MRNLPVLLFLIIFRCVIIYGQNPDNDFESRIDDIISQMSLEEKIDMLGGVDRFYTKSLNRLNIPKLKMADGPVGVRNYGPSTAYPASICLAASWDTQLAGRVGASIANEAKARNVHIVLGPAMNIYRGPWCGRNFEYLGEDPFLAGEIASNYIEGMQKEGVMATAKHYAANYQEYNRNNISSDMDERTLREIYLPAFKSCVLKGNVASVMTAYNLVNGVHCSQHNKLINEILKDEWGFKGFVMSDWTSTYDAVGAAEAGLDLEMPFAEYMSIDSLLPAIKAGIIDETVIDDKVRRMLRMMMKFNHFDHPNLSEGFNLNYETCREVALEAARGGIVLLKNDNILPLNKSEIKTIAVIGPNVHPAVTGGGGSSKVEPIKPVSVYEGINNLVGNDVKVLFCTGPFEKIPMTFYKENNEFWHEHGGERSEGLMAEVYDNMGFSGQPVLTMTDIFVDYAEVDMETKNIPKEKISIRWTGKISVNETDYYQFVVSGDDGYRLYVDDTLLLNEWRNQPEKTTSALMQLDKGITYDIKLEYYQDGGGASIRFGYKKYSDHKETKALEYAKQADVAIIGVGFDDMSESEGYDRTFKLPVEQEQFLKLILEQNKNSIVVLNSGGNVEMTSWLPETKALLHAWYPGQEGGQAVAEIIFGEINPSGKLPVSFEKHWEDNPTYKTYHDSDNDLKVYFDEGIFLGYRYYDTKNVEPLFPFGYGLSYTTFEYSNLKLDKRKMNVNDKFTIQVDIGNTGQTAGSEVVQIYIGDEKASLPRPEKELKGFGKIYLKPGEKKTVTIEIDKTAFSFYNDKKSSWITEPGNFEVLVGSSSRDIRLKETIRME